MSAIRPFYFLLFLLVGISACTDSNTKENKDEKTEKLPKVDKSRFRKVQQDRFSIEILKEMSLDFGKNNPFYVEGEFLPKEYHIRLTSIHKSLFLHDDRFPKDSEKQLKWFAKIEGSALISHLVDSEVGKLTETKVGKRRCFIRTIHGKEYGFPLRKTFFERYYQVEDYFVLITAWTIPENAKDFEKLVQYMGMTFKPN